MAIKKISANLLGNNAVTAASIAGGAISAADIANNSITAAKLAPNTITAAKISASTSPTFGGLTVNGTGTAQITSTAASTLELIRSGTAGQISSLIMKDGGNVQNRINSSGGALEFEYGASNINAIKIDNNGDISFYEDTGASAKLFWDASAERLGIGTTSPSAILHVASTGASNIKLEDTDNGFAATELNVENGGRDLKITTPQDTIFVQGSTEAMRILDGGNVGIGTDSPQDVLHVKNSTQAVGDAQVILEGRPAGYGTGISFQAQLTGGSLKEMARIVADGSASWNTTTTTQDARLRFFTTNDGTEAERMTIMSNGGVEIGDGTNYGYLKVISNAANAAVFDRRNSDGSLILFRNDDSTDGQINTLSGRIGIGSDDTGIFFDSTRDCVSPFSMNTNDGRGNAIDIGRDAVKFKDLYLSGTADVGDLEPNSEGTYANNHVGVYANGIVVNAASSQTGYLMSAGTGIVKFNASGGWIRLGGTAAANQLDDYEEGTWTPVLSASTTAPSVTYVSPYTQGRYIKIGGMVYATFEVRYTAQSGGSGNAIIGGLPFTRYNGYPDADKGSAADTYGITYPTTADTYGYFTMPINTTYMDINYARSGSTPLTLNITGCGTASGLGFIRGSITYTVV